jgi:hypothetical protein
MKKFNYRLVQKRVELTISIVMLAQEILKLLNMTFNYLQTRHLHHATL